MTRTRTRTVGAKVTDAEFALVTQTAGNRGVSAWVRDVLIRAAAPGFPDANEVLLAELLALRTIVLNVEFAHVAGEHQTPDSMQRLIDRADKDKLFKAQQRLALPAVRRER